MRNCLDCASKCFLAFDWFLKHGLSELNNMACLSCITNSVLEIRGIEQCPLFLLTLLALLLFLKKGHDSCIAHFSSAMGVKLIHFIDISFVSLEISSSIIIRAFV